MTPPSDDLTAPPTAFGRLRQIGLSAKDLDRAVQYYQDVLGLRLIARPGPLAFFDLNGTRLLIEADERSEPNGHALYFAVDDVHQARAALGARGATFLDDPHLIHRDVDGTFGPAGEEEWMTFFHDTEGNLLALSARQNTNGR